MCHQHTCLQGCRVKHRPLFTKYKIIIPPPPRGVNQQNLKKKENTLQEKFKGHLINDKSINWSYTKRMDDWLQHSEENTDVEQEWDDVKKHTTDNNRRKLRENKSYT